MNKLTITLTDKGKLDSMSEEERKGRVGILTEILQEKITNLIKLGYEVELIIK